MEGQPPGGIARVTDYGEQPSSRCGYCKQRGSVTHGMMAHTLSAEAYQELIDRGWRRSGTYVYFPIHERCCCQLLTIRLDATRYTPNKEQGRVKRRWLAYLEGAPLRGEQQEQPAAGQGTAAVAAGAPGSPRVLPGGSPKRPHDDLADWYQLGLQLEGQQGDGDGAGGSKRSRRGAAGGAGQQSGEQDVAAWGGGGESGDGDGHDAEERPARGASPASRLSEHLQQAMASSSLHWQGSGQLEMDGQEAQQPLQQPAQQQTAQRPQQQQQQHCEAGGLGGEARLAAALQQAVQQAVSGGQLPPAAYPRPKVQQPNAKQRKLLPPAVTHTTAFTLAVAATASKAQAAGNGGPARATAQEVAALLLQLLPAELAAGAQEAKGHLNFSLPQLAGEAGAAAAPEAAEAAAGVPAAAAAAAAAGGGGAAEAATHKGKQAKQQKPKQQQQARGRSGAAAGVPRGVPPHFELRTLPSSDPSLVEVEFPLFKKYQVLHHGDKPGDVSPSSFQRFLVDTPLRPVGPHQYPPGDCPPLGFGSFHQQYWLDGRLVAVSVVDVLPRCLSSVYLFWDPDMGPLSLGKLTSVLEIEWVAEVQRSCPSLRYYYLGYYIYNCHRMRYKGDYGPSELLCPKNKCWVPLDRIEGSLQQPGMVAISELPGALEGLGEEHLVDPHTHTPLRPLRQPSEEELSSCKIMIRHPRGHMVLTLGDLEARGLDEEQLSALEEQLGPWYSRAGAWAADLTAVTIA